MIYRVESGTSDNIRTEYPATRAAALRLARRLSYNRETAYVVGFHDRLDIGQIIYFNGAQAGWDGERI